MDNDNTAQQNKFVYKIIDRQMPLANIANIMKDAIPENGKIAKEAKEVMAKCASEFIAIVTCRAKDICEAEARKTVTGEDLVRAMEDLDLPYYGEIMKILVEKVKDALAEHICRDKKSSADSINFDNIME